MEWNLNGFITPEFLGTFSGAVAVVTLLTQLVKNFVTIADPKWIALTLAGAVSAVKQFALGDFSAAGWILAGLNTVVIAGAAIGMFEGLKGLGKFFDRENRGE
ncbi:MAG: hypothetical protein FWE08_07000 [Oscillospiraceae bacterium]|nr:hypothetical protein [Oscillospiraceae bacterium]